MIYYPEQKVERMRLEMSEEDFQDWYKVSLHRLIAVCKESSAKYTRSKLRKSLPPDFSYILEELLSENNRVVEKEEYYPFKSCQGIYRCDRRGNPEVSCHKTACDR